MNTYKTESQSAFATKKGSVLLTATIIAAIGMLIVASFIKLTNHELRLSNTQFYTNQSLNLAEAGLDEAMHLLHSENPAGWTVTGDTARLTVRDISSGRGATGEFDVLVEDLDGNPTVVSEGRVTSGSGLTSTKQLHMTLRPRSYFANGITAQCKVKFAGGESYVESFSSLQGFPPTHIKRDRASVATTSLESEVVVGNGHIWGYAFTGGPQNGGQLNVGPNGTIQGEDSPPTPNVDRKRVGFDFKASFPKALPPPGPVNDDDEVVIDDEALQALEAWLLANSIPRTVDDYIDSANQMRGSYQANYGTISSSTILGIPKGANPKVTSPMVVYADRIEMTGGTLHIVGPVILVVKNWDVKFSGGAALKVGFSTPSTAGRPDNTEEAWVRVYAYKDVGFSGNGGMQNETKVPNNLAIFGMGADVAECTFSQIFTLGGQAEWSALVYAPNADITLRGGGNSGRMSGAVVGMSVTINGGSKFYYDEEVEAFLKGFGWAMESWEEVPMVDRIAFN